MRELEDALHEAHADRSTEPHPLLTPELLQLKRPLERETADTVKEPEVDATEAIDAIGSLYARLRFLSACTLKYCLPGQLPIPVIQNSMGRQRMLGFVRFNSIRDALTNDYIM